MQFTLVQATGEAFSPQKENIQHFKNEIYNFFLYFVGHFCPPGSGSGLRIRIRIQGPGTPLNPDPIRIRIRIHSTERATQPQHGIGTQLHINGTFFLKSLHYQKAS